MSFVVGKPLATSFLRAWPLESSRINPPTGESVSPAMTKPGLPGDATTHDLIS